MSPRRSKRRVPDAADGGSAGRPDVQPLDLRGEASRRSFSSSYDNVPWGPPRSCFRQYEGTQVIHAELANGDLDRMGLAVRDDITEVTTIEHAASVRQLRKRALAADPNSTAVPVDVFLWQAGGPAPRGATRTGGLPYWPRDRRWPTCSGGKPMVFVVQLCFADSADLVSPAGDVLVVFARADRPAYPSGSDFSCFWMRLGIDDSGLIQETPEGVPQLPSAVGVRWRTRDYPDLDVSDELIYVPELCATKIGGSPFWVQDPEPAGRFLASFASIAVVDGEAPGENEYLKIGDMGSLYFYQPKLPLPGRRVRCVVQAG